jgi:phosphoribosyl 1,2-cyclic phosphate phosphodiesterase
VKYLILDGLRYQEHRTHFTIPEAVRVATELEIPLTYLTHMTHSVDYDEVSEQLPAHVQLAYDGLEIEFETFAPVRKLSIEKPPLEGSL